MQPVALGDLARPTIATKASVMSVLGPIDPLRNLVKISIIVAFFLNFDALTEMNG